MPHMISVEPDLDFKRQIVGLGAHDLSACYQCGTCSIVCPMSTPQNPFPRKEMVWVQWGLKDLALSNSSIWLCHQCSTCTAYCPRDAKPADVMAALRDYSIAHYAVPRFMGRAMHQPKYLPLLFAIPAVMFAAILAHLGHLTSLPDGEIVFSKFMPIAYVEATFIGALILSVFGAALGGTRYWRAMSAQSGQNGHGTGALVPTLMAIMGHRTFKQCDDKTVVARPTHKEHLYKSHLFVFYGFLGLVVTTTAVGVGIYAFGYLTPWPWWHPVKILGNVSGVAVTGAVAFLGYRRAVDKAGKSAYADWLFLAILFLTTLTGFMSELLRLSGMRALAYPTYFIHLLFIFFLLVYFPYSKLAHLVYRTVAMVHAGAVTHERPLKPLVLS